MHDLNTINRLNAEAFAASVDHYRAQGRFVVCTYTGLTLVSIETFGPEQLPLARAALSLPTDSIDTHRKLLSPICAPVGGRDQSEDRTLAALGAGEPIETSEADSRPRVLGDYVRQVEFAEGIGNPGLTD